MPILLVIMALCFYQGSRWIPCGVEIKDEKDATHAIDNYFESSEKVRKKEIPQQNSGFDISKIL